MTDKPIRLTMPGPTEAQVLAAVQQALSHHHAVAWHHRMNSGAGKLQYRDGTVSQFVRFGFPGCPDIIGQLKDGRFLAVEVKRPAGSPKKHQFEFLAQVQANGGVAFVARRVEDVFLSLDQLAGKNGTRNGGNFSAGSPQMDE